MKLFGLFRRKASLPRLVPFKGWGQYSDGSADIGQIAATFRDLNERLSRLEPKKRRYDGRPLSVVIDDIDDRLSKLEGKE